MTAGDALVSAIPTEPLAIYTGLVSGVVALFAVDAAASQQYMPLRWWMFGVTCALVVLWVVAGYLSRTKGSKDRRVPMFEIGTAVLAFAGWALVMPGSPLRTALDGTTEGVTTLCITFGGAAVIYLSAAFGLTQAARRKGGSGDE